MFENLSFNSQLYINLEELPLWNWDKILETGDLKYLFKKGKGRVSVRVFKVWLDLQDEFFELFGVSEQQKARERIIKRLIKLNLDLIKTDNRSLLNLIHVEEEKLRQLSTAKHKSIYRSKVGIEKQIGHRIDPKEISTREFYEMIEELIELNKQKDNGSDKRK